MKIQVKIIVGQIHGKIVFHKVIEDEHSIITLEIPKNKLDLRTKQILKEKSASYLENINNDASLFSVNVFEGKNNFIFPTISAASFNDLELGNLILGIFTREVEL